ncbi:MAG: hypothetical protein ACRELE_05630 [Gemmatimonadales bacterium]
MTRVARRMGHRRLNYLFSLVLLAIFVLRALPAWAQETSHHCAIHGSGTQSMPGMDHTSPTMADVTSLSWHGAHSDGCSHCPPAECEATQSCSTTAGASRAESALQPMPVSAQSPALGAASTIVASAHPELLTPPPKSLL